MKPITPQTIADRINGFRLDQTSRPTEDAVTDIIEEQSARVRGVLVHKGLLAHDESFDDLPSHSGSLVRGVIIDLCVSAVSRVRDRSDTSMSDGALERAREVLALIDARPSRLGAPTGGRKANLSHVSKRAKVAGRDSCCRRSSLLDRLSRDW